MHGSRFPQSGTPQREGEDPTFIDFKTRFRGSATSEVIERKARSKAFFLSDHAAGDCGFDAPIRMTESF